MAEPFIGEIRQVAFNYAPRGWAFCHGQIVSITENTALYSLLGTTYGGNGTTNFALPDFRGRVSIGDGYGPGLSAYYLGQRGGYEAVPLGIPEMPAHKHSGSLTNLKGSLGVYNALGNQTTVDGDTKSLAIQGTDNRGVIALDSYTFSTQNPDSTISNISVIADVGIGDTGGGQPHINMQPFTVINYIIAMDGLYPSRN